MTGHAEAQRERKLTYLTIGVVLSVLVWFLPVPGLPPAGVHALSLLVLASVLWLGGIGPLGTVSLFVLPLAVVLGVATPVVASSGFTNDITWLVTGSFFIAAAVSKVGLDRRIAYTFIKASSGNYLWLTLAIWGAGAVLGVVIPSALARMAVFLPIAQGLMLLLKAKPGSKLAANLEWTFFYVAAGGAIFSFPSILPMAVSLGVLSAHYGITISYAQFAVDNLLPSVIYIAIMWVSIHLVFKPEKIDTGASYKEFLEKKYLELGKTRPDEWKVLFWLIATIVAWIVGGHYGVSTGVVALLFGAFLFTPGLGALHAGDLGKISWDIVLFIGAVLALPGIMVQAGLTGYIQTALIGPILTTFSVLLGKYLGYAIGASLFMVLANFAIPSSIPIAAIFSPPLLSYAQSIGVNLVFASYTIGLNWLLGGFFPYQLTPLLLIWPLGGVKSFVECAKHSAYLFLPKLLVLVLTAFSWMVALRLL